MSYKALRFILGSEFSTVLAVKRCFIFTHYYSHNVYSEKTNLNLEARTPLRCRLTVVKNKLRCLLIPI
jgi:hypothetical protein